MKHHPMIRCIAALLLLSPAANCDTLAALRSLPVAISDREEPPIERAVRQWAAASTIDLLTQSVEERAALVAIIRFESDFARYVWDDSERCRVGPMCDRGRAWSVFQLQRTDRTGGFPRAARLALGRLRSAKARCMMRDARASNVWERAIALYGTGRTCEAAFAASRVAAMRELLPIVSQKRSQ